MALLHAIRNPAPTATRVSASTQPEVNAELERKAETMLAGAAVDKESIERRLLELEQEWDIERVLQTNFAAVTLLGITLGALALRPFYLLSGIAAAFMSEHALKGWCPPVPVFRRRGFRTAQEIARERYALKALRGDFRGLARGNPQQALEAAQRR